jgi:hypothetical protein
MNSTPVAEKIRFVLLFRQIALCCENTGGNDGW